MTSSANFLTVSVLRFACMQMLFPASLLRKISTFRCGGGGSSSASSGCSGLLQWQIFGLGLDLCLWLGFVVLSLVWVGVWVWVWVWVRVWMRAGVRVGVRVRVWGRVWVSFCVM